MLTSQTEQTIQTLEITREEEIAAPIDIVFETILEQMGPYNQRADGEPLPMKIEPWPGGRWFRDLGHDSGHLWGLVQSIKPPSLIEIQGPLFMSAPAISHVLYRLTEERGITLLKFSHRAMGLIAPEYLESGKVNTGWASLLFRIRQNAELRRKETKK